MEMDNHLSNLPFLAFPDTMAIESPASFHWRGLSPYRVTGLDTNGASSTVIQIPASFVVTPAAYREFMDKNRLDEVVDGLLEGANVKQIETLQRPSAQIKDIIQSAPIPEPVYSYLKEGFKALGGGIAIVWPVSLPNELLHPPNVPERCPYLQAVGLREAIGAIKTWWASLFDPSAIFYRELYGQEHRDTGITVAAQQVPILASA
jgi:pyruvate,water dikinase